MKPYLAELSALADCATSCYPNAGLPNAFGEYDDTPEHMAGVLSDFAREGWLNIVGGCCGTRPDHIAAIAAVVKGIQPRPVIKKANRDAPERPRILYRGDLFMSSLSTNFIMVGERTNVAGSPKFKRLVKEGDFEAALEIARQQVDNGAHLIDVNFDDGLLDGEACMTHFLHLVASEPDIARVPVMVDSSKWSVIEAGLQCLQGKGVVNSISLKEGEGPFLEQARRIQRYGAAVVVMAFDESGQADSKERKVEICQRAYRLLTEQIGFNPADIIFDPNVLTVATGIAEHDAYAVNFIEATRVIKATCPHAKVSGGISNISFAFRGKQRRARGDAQCLSLPRDACRARHGHRQCRDARRLRRP